MFQVYHHDYAFACMYSLYVHGYIHGYTWLYASLYTLDGRHGETRESGLCSEYARFLVWMIKTLMIFIHFSEIKHASFGAGK